MMELVYHVPGEGCPPTPTPRSGWRVSVGFRVGEMLNRVKCLSRHNLKKKKKKEKVFIVILFTVTSTVISPHF